MLLWEKKAFHKKSSIIIGVDEAGRGPLAGPVVAAAVMLKTSRFPFSEYKEKIADSKKLTPKQRLKSFSEITKKSLFGIHIRNHSFIDRENIHKATLIAMEKAVYSLLKKYRRINKQREKDISRNVHILIDGAFLPDLPYKKTAIVKGDSKSISIAAASIVAKVLRDKIMLSYDKKYPEYGFSIHKGYGTKAHFDAIHRHGPCQIHRKTFAPIKYL